MSTGTFFLSYIPTHSCFRAYGHPFSHLHTYVPLIQVGTYLRTRFFVSTCTFCHPYVPTYSCFRAYGHLFSYLRTYVQLFSHWYVPTYTFFAPTGTFSYPYELTGRFLVPTCTFLHSLTLLPRTYAHVLTYPPSNIYIHLPVLDVFLQPSQFTTLSDVSGLKLCFFIQNWGLRT